MRAPPLLPEELALLQGVFSRHPEIDSVKIFGSRAKGTHTAGSDADLALWGEVDALGAEAITAELDELPLPFLYDLRPFHLLRPGSLREHIERVGILIYPAGKAVSQPENSQS